MSNVAPVRVLHVIAQMNRGGAETWIMNVYRRIDRDRIQFDFCVNTSGTGAYDEEIRALGGRIFPLEWRDQPRQCGRLLGAFLRDNRYKIVHSHLYLFSGYTLRVAAQVGVANRLAHLHTMSDGRRTTLPRRVYRGLMTHLIRRNATRVLGCSSAAVANVLGRAWQRDARAGVVYYGTPLESFAAPPDAAEVRREIGVAAGTPLVIHVSNFGPAKNPLKLVDIFAALHEQRPDADLVLVGDGPLRQAALERARARGVDKQIRVLGIRPDVPRLMQAADVMLMPSVREGMPVTMLEASAAGLRVVMSDLPGIREAFEICGEGALLAPARPDAEWASALADALERPRTTPAEALAKFRNSPFSSEASARRMEQVYASCARMA